VAHNFVGNLFSQLVADEQAILCSIKNPQSVGGAYQTVGERFNNPKVQQSKERQLLGS
jgi:hypothetical protein